MIIRESRNTYGYMNNKEGMKLMAEQIGDYVVAMTEGGNRHFIELLRVREVEEILRECQRLTADRHYFAKKIKRRREDGSKQNGYYFWWEKSELPPGSGSNSPSGPAA